ncbi:hypothetical protein E3V93_08360 [Microbacterium sp. 3H14]|uniref:hypothetical protein n=1 Tax=unclassified Microbacterium TaxID=2609290 RepID=UPI001069B4BE|nr:hypothetical protein [Microbacterium sp. 3H14]TFB16634.1 hypothetical protein E3V93_08360 [Microbacterium sp. 3H14]
MKRPLSTGLGAVLMSLRVVWGFISILIYALNWAAIREEVFSSENGLEAVPADVADLLIVIGLCALGVWYVFYGVLAGLVFAGANWARIVAMSFASLSIIVVFLDWWNAGIPVTFRTSLASVALDILVLLALSAQSARGYARRNDPRSITTTSYT